MNLLIDDKKEYLLDINGDKIILDIIARNYEAGIDILGGIGIDVLYLDFDLGAEETGLDVLFDAVERYGSDLPLKIQLVTMNPAGRKQMEDYLKEIGYEFKNGYWRK